MTWTPAAQVEDVIAASPLTRTITHTNNAGATQGTFPALLLHTQPDQPPSAIAAWNSTQARTVVRGDYLVATGLDPFLVVGVRPDGAYLVTFALRMHINEA